MGNVKRGDKTYTYTDLRFKNISDTNYQDKKYYYPEIRVTGLSPKTLTTLSNIAENNGYRTTSALMKFHIRQYITNITGQETPQTDGRHLLKTHAKNKGYGTLNNLMKYIISQIIKNASERDKLPPD